MPSSVLTALQKASQGLLYPSDTDEPFEAFAWGKAAGDLDAETVRQLARGGAGGVGRRKGRSPSSSRT